MSQSLSPSTAPYGRRGASLHEPLRHLSTGTEGTAVLARDGTSEVVEVRHATVARTDPARWRVIEGQAKAYTMLEHPSWRQLVAIEVEDDTPVLVFERLEDDGLSERMARGLLTQEEACAIWTQIVPAVAEVHRLGFVHGHIGPSVIRMRRDGTPVLDFPWLDVGSQTSSLDAACAPPEAGREPLDVGSDVYALGALLKVLFDAVRAPHTGREVTELATLAGQMRSEDRDERPTLEEVCAVLVPTTNPALPRLRPGAKLGRFRLVRKIGEGGMGEVYHAVDLATGVDAALKVLRPDASADPASRRRFRKEARILSEIRSPYVANLIEINHDTGVDFLAIEFVDGENLDAILRRGTGRLPEAEALGIVADVCRGLVEAHARGVVHRDIKPQNIMIAKTSASGEGPRLKLCDFGIARSLTARDVTMAFTEKDFVLGTPDFMAPEQCAGRDLSPATDVYALGAMLFLLITGRPPFEGNDPTALFLAHTSQAPPELRVMSPDTSEATSALAARMMQKAPADRFADASALLEAIERIQRGDPTSIELHPTRPLARADRVVAHVFEYHLTSPAEALWPYVSNTNRLNRAVHLPPAVFKRIPTATGGETTGNNRIAGVDLRWHEYPFEWVEGRRWGVLRVFEGGVMRWFTITLELFPKPGGGTLLRYTMTLEPRHWFGRLMVAIEMRWKQRAALGKAFARIDGHAGSRTLKTAGADAFEPPKPLGEAARSILERHVTRLAAEGVKQDVLDALVTFCESAPDQEVSRLRPLALARVWSLDPDRVVDACLRGAYHGLFGLLWEVLCPLCRVPADFTESLRTLADHGRCPSCNVDFTLDFAQSLELVFRVSPDVRTSELRTFCIGGPAFAPHVVAQVRVAPMERVALDLALGNGAYKIRTPQLVHGFALHVSHAGRSHRGSARFTAEPPPDGGRILVAPGVQSIDVDNALDREIVVRVERTAAREDALTAARAACLASFRKLFPGEVLASGRLVAVGRTAFLVTAVRNQRSLLTELGDARAFELVLEHLRALEDVVANEGGALVKTSSGMTLAAFESASSAARAAAGMHERLEIAARDSGVTTRLDVRVVVHQGPAVAATFDDRLDYFGSTVETAMDLAALAPAGRVLLSSAVAEDPHVIADLKASGFSLEPTRLGDSGGLGVMAIRAPASSTSYPTATTVGAF